jgi:hypothetical protein
MGTELCHMAVSMVVVPGLSESLGAAGKRIIHFDTTDALLSVEAASSARRARCPTCLHGSTGPQLAAPSTRFDLIEPF